MAQNSNLVLCTAEYGDVAAALRDLDAIEELHKDEMIGPYDAAVIDKENGRPRIVKRMDRPRIKIIPEELGSGRLPRKDLKDAAEGLTSNQAGLIVIGEPRRVCGFRASEAYEGRVDRGMLDENRRVGRGLPPDLAGQIPRVRFVIGADDQELPPPDDCPPFPAKLAGQRDRLVMRGDLYPRLPLGHTDGLGLGGLIV